MPVYKTLDQLKEEFKKTYLADKVIYQKDVMDALEHLDLTDNDMDDLYEWFAAEGIDISEDDDIEELENIEIPEAGAMTQDIGDDLEFLAEDAGEDFDEEVEDVEVPIDLSETYSSSPYVRINDPVKMYLKEIGRVPLLNPEDEPEIARRIQAGDEEAKADSDFIQPASGRFDREEIRRPRHVVSGSDPGRQHGIGQGG